MQAFMDYYAELAGDARAAKMVVLLLRQAVGKLVTRKRTGWHSPDASPAPARFIS
jgi:hypothetical protein